MKIIILKAYNYNWYYHDVGKIFDVYEIDSNYFALCNDNDKKIIKSNCCEIYENFKECNGMEFIKLTFIFGGKLRIKKSNICDYYYDVEKTTTITANDKKYYVKETIEEIDKLLEI